MADEPGGKRRRGKRGGRNRPGGQQGAAAPKPGDQTTPEQPPVSDMEAPLGAVAPETGAQPSASQASGKSSKRERSASASSAKADGSPMDFWRSGSSRSHRERGAAGSGGKGGGGIMNRLRHMYFPPWVPVVAIIFVVFGILGLLFVTRSATGSPRIGNDHWHASYTFYACGEKQPNAPEWSSGVHTHSDGIIHIHPFTAAEEGAGARLVKWFEYGDGKLDGDEIRLPGLSKTWKNGETCPEGSPEAGTEGKLQVFVNSEKMDDWTRYIPKDGDRIRLVFGAEEEFVQLDDRQVIPESNATREVTITVTGNEAATSFDPASIQLKTGEAVKVILKNESEVSHGLRFRGGDDEYDNGDDFVVVPVGSDPNTADQGDIIEPGGEGFTVIRFDDPVESQFKDPTASDGATGDPYATGSVIVSEAGSATPGPGEGGTEVAISSTDAGYEPAEITAKAGEPFTIVITNSGQFAESLRIDGPDGEFDTDDDLLSEDVAAGTTGELVVAEGLEAGAYAFRDDFHPNETGTLRVE